MEAYRPDPDILARIRSSMAKSYLRRLRTVTAHLVSRLSSYDVGTAQATVLLTVCALDDAEPARIADTAFIPRQTMTAILDKLENAGLVVRTDHPSDRRRKIVCLTKPGFEKAAEIWAGIGELENDVMSVLSPHEARMLDVITAKLGRRLEEADARPDARIR